MKYLVIKGSYDFVSTANCQYQIVDTIDLQHRENLKAYALAKLSLDYPVLQSSGNDIAFYYKEISSAKADWLAYIVDDLHNKTFYGFIKLQDILDSYENS